MEVTAKLRNVRLEKVPDSKAFNGFSLIAHGEIYGDTRGRFPDGSSVTTSRILSMFGRCIVTQNSVYEVE